MAIFKDVYSGSIKSIHDSTITCSFSLHPWFTTLHNTNRLSKKSFVYNTSSLFKSVAFKLLPMPGHHQRVKIADHYYVTDIWKTFGRYSVEVNATTIPDGQECFQFHVSSR